MSRKNFDKRDLSTARRNVLKGTAMLVGGLGVASTSNLLAAQTVATTGRSRTDRLIARSEAPIARTTSGPVAGYCRNGIATFKGIPYADTTEGAKRFLPPTRPTPWTAPRSSRQYGSVCPQGPRYGWANDEEAFMFAWDDGVQGEDCLRVNVWTPGVGGGKKRPVMVWLHGGGFFAGSSQELRAYDGENLSRRGDVVVVSLNHRLNVFGFLDLSRYGERYATSGNVGMLDIVAALEWVRDNIAEFGGDPNCVTIFGQSGGGAKVNTLMAMPSAHGLFHRAIVQSGSMLRALTPEMSANVTDEVFAELGLTPATLDRLHSMPTAQLVHAAASVVGRHLSESPGGVPNFRKLAEILAFAPVVDGTVLPTHPFDPVAPAIAAHVPMLIGSTLNEFVNGINHPEYELLSTADLEQRVRMLFGDRGERIIQAFRQRTPGASPFDLWSRIAAASVRSTAIDQAVAQAAAGSAPAYLYWLTWQTPILDGRPRAFHCSEIPFVFDNTERCDSMTGGGPDARDLGGTMSDAWIQFARTGNPNHENLPHWPNVSREAVATMLFDRRPAVVINVDRDEQASIVG